ncbi:hypothetical protein BGX30_001790 [Mortierella sp. GBA39]|nr:hypothetical protein BGX30_001790 [Mortierella sp. GBA39]
MAKSSSTTSDERHQAEEKNIHEQSSTTRVSHLWTIRKSVRKAVYADISPKRLTSGSKEHCSPVAVDCIHGLQKLFRERLAAAAGPSRVPSSSLSPVDHRIHRNSYLQVDDNSRPATSTAGNPEVFTSLGQAQRSLR